MKIGRAESIEVDPQEAASFLFPSPTVGYFFFSLYFLPFSFSLPFYFSTLFLFLFLSLIFSNFDPILPASNPPSPASAGSPHTVLSYF